MCYLYSRTIRMRKRHFSFGLFRKSFTFMNFTACKYFDFLKKVFNQERPLSRRERGCSPPSLEERGGRWSTNLDKSLFLHWLPKSSWKKAKQVFDQPLSFFLGFLQNVGSPKMIQQYVRYYILAWPVEDLCNCSMTMTPPPPGSGTGTGTGTGTSWNCLFFLTIFKDLKAKVRISFF
uniref:GIY-YIG endonuclease n=1 Tax=Morchella brunnea TaxID=1174671 RepID=A0A8K1MGC1_9PEZI|nr:GIY-YIG endonuclease [Morchella brunnea]UBU98358.1 GIY-YIG endonuclease [Morchella brunnea]